VSRESMLLGLVGLVGLAMAGCGAATGAGEGGVIARVQYTPRDSVRFVTSASLQRCGGGRGFVLEGEVQGNGVLVWLRPDESMPRGRYRIIQRGDTLTPRGAVVAVRFMTAELAHGVVLDSGSVTVTVNRDSRAGRRRVLTDVDGSGLETVGARRVRVVAAFATSGPPTSPLSPPPPPSAPSPTSPHPLGADTLRCEARP